MKILFVISKYYPKVGGTPNCLRNLVHHIRGDHEVQVLTTMDRVDDGKTASVEGITVHKRLSYGHIAMQDLLRDESLPPLTRLRALAGKTFFRLVPIEPLMLRLRFRRAIRKLQKKEQFDWVVAVGGDIVPARALLGCRGLKHTAFYQLDPYTTNTTLPAKGIESRCRLEQKLHSSFDLIVTTPMICHELSLRFPLGSNVTACNFPNITDRTAAPAADTEQIRCVFCGAMYAARNMDRTLAIVDRVTREDPQIFFDFYVLGDTSAVKKAAAENPNICLFDPVPPTEIFSVMQSRQALVNIGNVMTNQVPSKIYDYISTGLPVLNFCCNADCPTIAVLENYPLALNLLPEEPVEAAAALLAEFLKENRGKRVQYPHIETHYYENTIACVAQRMLDRMGEREKTL